LKSVEKTEEVSAFNGSTISVSQQDDICDFELYPHINFFINAQPGSILLINGE